MPCNSSSCTTPHVNDSSIVCKWQSLFLLLFQFHLGWMRDEKSNMPNLTAKCIYSLRFFIKCEWNSFWQELVIISMTLFRFFFRVVIDLLVHQTDKVHILSYELLKWIWHSTLKKRQETDAWLGTVLTLWSQIISWSVVIFSCVK